MAKHKTDIIFGIHAVESVLKSNPEQVLQLWVQKGRHDKRMQTILGLAGTHGVSVESCSRDVLQKKSSAQKHQGVVAKIRTHKQSRPALEDILAKPELLLLVLDGVQDPHNLGACLRSADASAVDAVIVSRNRSPGLTPVVRNVASGAAETTPFIQVSNLARALQQLKDNDVWIVGAAGEASTSLYDSSASNRLAIVMGSEGQGLRRLTREHCDELVFIPMQGQVESLNVSVATGICLFEYRRKLAQMTHTDNAP
jgi:23S rRNA (guanosine2251-2'-O)-methyltransferase